MDYSRPIMKTIRCSRILSYYDAPQVIEAYGDDGQSYIGVMVEPEGLEDRFALTAVAADRLNDFLLGMVDLRAIFLERYEGECFLGTLSNGTSEPFSLKCQTEPLDEYRFLPAPGFFLSEPEEEKENPSGREAGGVSAGKPLEIGPPPLRREVDEGSLNPS